MDKENETLIKALNMFGRIPEQWELLNEIERLNNILDEIDLIFYRMRFIEFNSINDELKFLNENINEVRKICQNKKLKGE